MLSCSAFKVYERTYIPSLRVMCTELICFIGYIGILRPHDENNNMDLFPNGIAPHIPYCYRHINSENSSPLARSIDVINQPMPGLWVMLSRGSLRVFLVQSSVKSAWCITHSSSSNLFSSLCCLGPLSRHQCNNF